MKTRTWVVAAIALTFGLGPATSADKVVLITADEAAQPAQPAGELNRRGVTRGPKIVLVSPASAAATSPLHVQFKFETFGGARIDSKDVKVVYLKKPAIDLTDRVKPFVQGSGIDIDQAEVPPGQHVLRVDVTDSDGRAATGLFTLNVAR
jgi:hypothetical protein